MDVRAWQLVMFGALLSACGGGLPEGLDTTTDDVPEDTSSMALSCTEVATGTLVLSEVLADADGADTGHEWVEVFNASATAVTVQGLSLYVAWDSERKNGNHPITDAIIEPYGYLVLAAEPVSAASSATATTKLSLPNDVMRVSLLCGERVIDSAVLDAPLEGSPWVLDGLTRPDSILNDQYDRWCAGIDFPATPGADNPSCNFDYIDRGQALCLGDDGLPRSVDYPVTGEVVITEIMADPFMVGDASGEWVELEILATVDLNQSWLEIGADTIVELNTDECLTFTAGERVVIAAQSDQLLNGDVPNDFTGTLSLTNSGGALGIFANGYAIDTTEWPQATPGIAWQRDPTTGAWCLADSVYGLGDLGTPNAANIVCSIPGLRPADPGDLIITEIMKNPMGTEGSTWEWFELYNPTNQNFDIGGCDIKDDGADLKTISGSVVVTAHTYVVLAEGDVTAFTEVFQWGSAVQLSNTSDEVVLDCDGVEIDAVRFTTTGWPNTEGRALSLDDNALGFVTNDTGSNWCNAATAITGTLDYGTPATANPSCP